MKPGTSRTHTEHGLISSTPETLIHAIQDVVDRAGVPLKKQIRALEELFSLFTAGRARLRRTSYLDDPRYRTAYLRYHVPLNFARAAWVLAQVRAVLPDVDRLEHVVDLGAGLGSASLATLHVLPGAPLREYTLFDRSRAALKVARHLLERSAGPSPGGTAPAIRTRAATLPPVPEIPSAALVWMCMLLNELGIDGPKDERPETFVEHVTARIPPGSVLILIEPAQREPGRRLLAVHDAFVASGAWRVLAPCTHDRACPLVAIRSRPWCHFHFEWRHHEYVRRVASPLGLSSPRSSLAFLAVGRGETATPRFRGAARVVGDVMKVGNGGSGVYVCQDGKRKELSPAPRGSRRGDIIETRADGGHHRLLCWQPIDKERT